MYVCMHVCVCMYVCIYVCACIYVCMYVCIQLLVTVLTRGEVTEMMSLAVTAAQCMNQVAIAKEIREFTHKGKADGVLLEKVCLS